MRYLILLVFCAASAQQQGLVPAMFPAAKPLPMTLEQLQKQVLPESIDWDKDSRRLEFWREMSYQVQDTEFCTGRDLTRDNLMERDLNALYRKQDIQWDGLFED